jgi:hypothetical protein
MAYVIIQCGSAARGDTNKYSDEDFVCIHDKVKLPFNYIKNQYKNISFLSLGSIQHMKNSGSLFLAHIDIDGQIIEGEPTLKQSISGFRPDNKNLKKSIQSSSIFISGIEWYPSSDEGKLWLLDVLYVSFRNILYCTNAINKNYSFGFKQAMSTFGLSEEEKLIMLQIREGKYLYRTLNRKSDILGNFNADNISSVAIKMSSGNCMYKEGGKTNWMQKWSYDYWDERLIERAIVNHEINNNGFREKLHNRSYYRRNLPVSVKQYVQKAQQVTAVDQKNALL